MTRVWIRSARYALMVLFGGTVLTALPAMSVAQRGLSGGQHGHGV